VSHLTCYSAAVIVDLLPLPLYFEDRVGHDLYSFVENMLKHSKDRCGVKKGGSLRVLAFPPRNPILP
jgi:hypothetical protein